MINVSRGTASLASYLRVLFPTHGTEEPRIICRIVVHGVFSTCSVYSSSFISLFCVSPRNSAYKRWKGLVFSCSVRKKLIREEKPQ